MIGSIKWMKWIKNFIRHERLYVTTPTYNVYEQEFKPEWKLLNSSDKNIIQVSKYRDKNYNRSY